MFRNRQHAAMQLAERLKGRPFRNPLVLGIPRGGVVTGAVLARLLGAELDVVLARKLRAPGQPELAIGAVSEAGEIHLHQLDEELPPGLEDYLAAERRHQMSEIARRRELFRTVRPQAPIHGRSVIVTDDGIATGSTMVAALNAVRAQDPYELIVAVPVAAPDRAAEVRRHCDDLVCLMMPRTFFAIGQFYEDFSQVEDEEVVALLREQAAQPGATQGAALRDG